MRNKKLEDASEVVTQGYLDLKLEEQERKVDDKQVQYHSEVMTRFDKMMKILTEIREEQVVGFHQVEERFENHEVRIQRLEKLQPAA